MTNWIDFACEGSVGYIRGRVLIPTDRAPDTMILDVTIAFQRPPSSTADILVLAQ